MLNRLWGIISLNSKVLIKSPVYITDNLQRAQRTPCEKVGLRNGHIFLSLQFFWLLLSFIFSVACVMVVLVTLQSCKKNCLIDVRDKTKWRTRKKTLGNGVGSTAI